MTLAECLAGYYVKLAGNDFVISVFDDVDRKLVKIPANIDVYNDFDSENDVYAEAEDEDSEIHALLPWLDREVWEITSCVNWDVVSKICKNERQEYDYYHAAAVEICLGDIEPGDEKVLNDEYLACDVSKYTVPRD